MVNILNCNKFPVHLLQISENMKKFSISESFIIISCIICIFVSEWIYLVQGNPMKAIFIGLWPPTILGLLNFFNSKRQ